MRTCDVPAGCVPALHAGPVSTGDTEALVGSVCHQLTLIVSKLKIFHLPNLPNFKFTFI